MMAAVIDAFAVSPSANGRHVEVAIDPAAGEFDGMLEERTIELQLHTRAAPMMVVVNGKEIKERSKRDKHDKSKDGWFFDSGDRGGVAYVKTGKLNVRESNSIVVEIDTNTKFADGGGYPDKPAGDVSLYDAVRVEFEMWGVSQEDAKLFVKAWKQR